MTLRDLAKTYDADTLAGLIDHGCNKWVETILQNPDDEITAQHWHGYWRTALDELQARAKQLDNPSSGGVP